MAKTKKKVTDVAKAVDKILVAAGEELRRLRLGFIDPETNAPMTQEKLAELSNCSVSYVSMLERGQRQVQLPILIALALTLNTTPAAIMFPVPRRS